MVSNDASPNVVVYNLTRNQSINGNLVFAEMARLGPETRKKTDALDTVGNRTAAIGI